MTNGIIIHVFHGRPKTSDNPNIFSIMTYAHTTIFTALANETRLRCILLLTTEEELCVRELTYALQLSQPHISRHLAQLREAGLVTDRRAGVWVHYRINRDLPSWCQAIIQNTATGIASLPPFCDDAELLASMPDRPHKSPAQKSTYYA